VLAVAGGFEGVGQDAVRCRRLALLEVLQQGLVQDGELGVGRLVEEHALAQLDDPAGRLLALGPEAL
jgi:hypothetical protein